VTILLLGDKGVEKKKRGKGGAPTTPSWKCMERGGSTLKNREAVEETETPRK